MENHPSQNWIRNSQKIYLILSKILKSYFLKLAKAGVRTRDILLSFNSMLNTLPLSQSSLELYQGKFYKGLEYNILSTRLNSPTSSDSN